MSAPEPRSALADHLIPSRRDGAGANLGERCASVVEISARQRREKDLDAAIGRWLGAPAPPCGRSASASGVTLMRISPTTSLAIGPDAKLAGLSASIPRDVAAVVDQAGGFAILRIAGLRAVATLEKVCRIDLHSTAFGPGRAGRTLMAQTPIVIHQVDDAPTFELIVPRTLARSFADALLRSGRDYGLAILPPETA